MSACEYHRECSFEVFHVSFLHLCSSDSDDCPGSRSVIQSGWVEAHRTLLISPSVWASIGASMARGIGGMSQIRAWWSFTRWRLGGRGLM